MESRGLLASGKESVSTAFYGEFKTNASARAQFLFNLRKKMRRLTGDEAKRAVCLIISLVDNFAIALVIPLLPSIAAAGGTVPGQWVWILPLNGTCLTIGPFTWGRVVTKCNSGQIITVTLFVKALCTVTLGFAFDSWIGLLVNRALSGAMFGTTLATRL